MFKATAGKTLPTTIIGSLPRPSWYTENLGTRSFLEAMVSSRYREQYTDALSVYLREQEIAKLATEAELRALRAQVNPHFLFNALTTIGYLIQTAPPKALKTLMRLTAMPTEGTKGGEAITIFGAGFVE